MASGNKVVLFYITRKGRDLAERIAAFTPDAQVHPSLRAAT